MVRDEASEHEPPVRPNKSPTPGAAGDAEFARGEALRKGEGVQKNPIEAWGWYQRAAEMGHAGALHRMGVLYALGEGVPKDDVKAVRFHRLAAELGFAEAQYDLGVRCILGLGTPKDEKAGLEWYRKAAAQGWPEAIEALRQREVSARGK
ncbi:MAG: hypothetical protein DLM73_03705 [Chthoniobacterales bacterium]|nr:MAG: hypothetical protein DLM73_03705 [Chthoniobacterales bacterium]